MSYHSDVVIACIEHKVSLKHSGRVIEAALVVNDNNKKDYSGG